MVEVKRTSSENPDFCLLTQQLDEDLEKLSELEAENPAGGENIEALRQKAAINLLLSDIDEHRGYLREIERDIRDNSDDILEGLGLSHLKKGGPADIFEQAMAGEEIETIDRIALENADRLETIIAQNCDIIARLDEIGRLLRERVR